jgi:hypothetical protein
LTVFLLVEVVPYSGEVQQPIRATAAWSAGRSAQLRGWLLLVATSIALGLGIAMILLKDVVLTHLH